MIAICMSVFSSCTVPDYSNNNSHFDTSKVTESTKEKDTNQSINSKNENPTNSTTTNIEKHTEATDSTKNIYYRNEELNGRGTADNGRNEPDYINVIGYTVISSKQAYDIEKNDSFQNLELWKIPTYVKDKQVYNKTEVFLPHKTEVVVLEQLLKHEGYGGYSGYLLVEKTNDKSQYYIDVNNFITKPYWNYTNDLISAAKTGDYIAKYNQKSDYYPVDNRNSKVELDNGTLVLVKGVTGTYGNKGPDKETNQIEAIVWKDWKLDYGGVPCYFNTADLEIVY